MKQSTTTTTTTTMTTNEEHLRILEKHKIECADVSEILGDYYEGDLVHSLKLRIEDHINECSFCRDFNASYRAVISLAKELRNRPVSRQIEDGVQKRLRIALNQKLGLNLPF